MIKSTEAPFSAEVGICCLRTALLLLLLSLVTGCALDRPYRPASPIALNEPCATSRSGTHEAFATTCSGGSPVEIVDYKSEAPGTSGGVSGQYILGYVEFDDQGWFHDMGQRTAFFRSVLADRTANPKQQYLVVTFAHGWKHNAKETDNNLKEFRKLLERLDTLEKRLAADPANHKTPRKVVGLYLGWRGHSLSIPLLENVTFWTRKNAGERVGDRSPKQLLVELNEFREYLNGWTRYQKDALAGPNETQLIMIGHSFGGLLMYHALHTELIERALLVERHDDKEPYHYGTAKSFGDFILLVNPAFEGAAYEPLYAAAMSRCYAGNQRPAMAVITSKTDRATDWAFPLGRLYTYAESAPQKGERTTVLNTVGHLDRYITHELHYDPRAGNYQEKTKGSPPTSRQQAEKTATDVAGGLKEVEQTGKTRYGEVTVSKAKLPAGHPEYPRNYPYLVMSADKEVISNHNDIWNPRFVDFMVSFITKEIMGKGEMAATKDGGKKLYPPFWEKPEQSCQD